MSAISLQARCDIPMNLKLILLALMLSAILAASGSATVVINEVELDPSGDDVSQWIELYNTEDVDVDISSWSVVPLSDRAKEEFIDIANISAKGFYVITFEEQWMDPSEESLILKDEMGTLVDRTPFMYDYSDSDCVWGRAPDGSNIWLFLTSTQGEPTLGELCEEEESSQMHFNMDQSVAGSGYVRIRNVMHNMDTEYLKSRESGSGTYSSEEASKYHADLMGSAYAMDLSKSNLSARYSNATFSVSPERSLNYASKWTESSSAHGSQESPSICESHTDAARLDSDIIVHYRNFDLGARISSDYDGVGRINSNLSNFRASEEYAGRFNITNDYKENISDEISLSVDGEGFISTDKKIGSEGETDQYAYTYEKGTGEYHSEELIDASDISTINISPILISPPSTSNIFLAKDVSLRQAPVNHSYARVTPLPMSLSWSEGTGSGAKNGAFMRSEYSDLRELDAETLIISANETRTSARFTGRARFQSGYINSSDPEKGFVFIEDEFVGNFSIVRGHKVYPALNKPHMSITNQGRIDPQDCGILRYIITLANDGNRPLGPVFVRTSFPTGTSYLDSSIRPFELSSRYANWSISRLSIGEAVKINLDLRVTARKENYSSSSRAVTVYQAIRSYEIKDKETGNITVFQTSSDRRLSASNTSKFEADWSACSAGNLSVDFTARPNSKLPKILSYRLTLENKGRENLSANITVNLPSGISFINSTSRQENISKDIFRWTLDKLDVGKRRSISFMAKGEEEGFYVSNATIIASSRDNCRKIASATIEASQEIGGNLSSDRRPGASNTTQFEADCGSCASGNFSVAFSATPNSKQPKILGYRLTLDNLASENVSANITVVLPSGMNFINSTSRQKNISEDMFSWTLDRLDAGKKRSISFMAEAEEEGFYLTNASVIVYSLHDCPEIASARVAAPVMVGKTVYSITPTFWQDWCPCDENLLEKRLSWNETSIKSGKDLGCLC